MKLGVIGLQCSFFQSVYLGEKANSFFYNTIIWNWEGERSCICIISRGLRMEIANII